MGALFVSIVYRRAVVWDGGEVVLEAPSGASFRGATFPPSPLGTNAAFTLESGEGRKAGGGDPATDTAPEVSTVAVVALADLSPGLSSDHFSGFSNSSSVSISSVTLSTRDVDTL